MFFCPSRQLHDLRNYTLLLGISTLHTVPPVYTKHINNINIIHVIRVYQEIELQEIILMSALSKPCLEIFFQIRYQLS